jgi:hypothetical protein
MTLPCGDDDCIGLHSPTSKETVLSL